MVVTGEPITLGAPSTRYLGRLRHGPDRPQMHSSLHPRRHDLRQRITSPHSQGELSVTIIGCGMARSLLGLLDPVMT